MEQDLGLRNWMRTVKPVRPDFAALVAAAVARQATSPTAQVLAGADAGGARTVSLIELFGERARPGRAGAGSFNTGVAARLSPEDTELTRSFTDRLQPS